MARGVVAGPKSGAHLVSHLVLLLAVVVVLFPFLWIAAAAFKRPIALLLGTLKFTPTLANFQEVLASKTSDYVSNFANSLIVACASTAIVLVVGLLGAYSLVRLRWPRWVTLVFLIWAFMFQMLPPVTLASAWFELFDAIGLRNTLTAVVLGHTTLNMPMALWLLAAFLRDVPREIEEAARIDGASDGVLLFRVLAPVALSGIVATGLLVFIFSWNEFLVALVLTGTDTATVPVAIAKFSQANEIKYTEMAAASVISAIPALLALVFGQRFIVKGLTSGAVK